MKKQLLTILAYSAACLMAAAQGQSSSSQIGRVNRPSDSLSGSESKDKSLDPSSSSSTSSSEHSRLSPTGRMGQHEIRASQLKSSSIKSSSGEDLGKIEDVIINPGSGRVDFAVISLSSSGSSGTQSSSSSTTPSSSTSPSSSSTSPSSTSSTTPS